LSDRFALGVSWPDLTLSAYVPCWASQGWPLAERAYADPGHGKNREVLGRIHCAARTSRIRLSLFSANVASLAED
jgi:hypothetical protein